MKRKDVKLLFILGALIIFMNLLLLFTSTHFILHEEVIVIYDESEITSAYCVEMCQNIKLGEDVILMSVYNSSKRCSCEFSNKKKVIFEKIDNP